MALTNKEILRQIEKFSKEFLAKLDRFSTTVVTTRPTIVTTALIESTLSTISTTLSSILTEALSIATSNTVLKNNSASGGTPHANSVRNLDITNLATFGGKFTNEWLSDMESSLNTLITHVDGLEALLGTGGPLDIALGAGGFIGGTALGLGGSLLSGAGSIVAGLSKVEESIGGAATWDFQVTETITIAGTIIFTFTVPTGQKLTSWWIQWTVSGGATTPSIFVDQQDGSGRRLRRIFTVSNQAQGVFSHIPHIRATDAGNGYAAGNSVGWPGIPASHVIVVSFTNLTAVGPDVINLNAGGALRDTTAITSAKTGTGTSTQSNLVNQEIE